MRVLASAAIPTRSITRRQRRLCSSGETPEYSAALDQIQSSAFTTSPHGVPMIEQKHPGGEQKAPPRTHGIEAALQTGKVPLHHISARRQQSDSKKEKAVRRKRRRNRDMKVRVWAGRCFFKPTSRRPKTGVCATLARSARVPVRHDKAARSSATVQRPSRLFPFISSSNHSLASFQSRSTVFGEAKLGSSKRRFHDLTFASVDIFRCPESNGVQMVLVCPKAQGRRSAARKSSPQRDTVQVALHRLAREGVYLRLGAKRHIVRIYPPRSRQLGDRGF